MGERLDRTQEVAGSSPASSTRKGPQSVAFAMVSEMDDTEEAGNVLRVKEWELTA